MPDMLLSLSKWASPTGVWHQLPCDNTTDTHRPVYTHTHTHTHTHTQTLSQDTDLYRHTHTLTLHRPVHMHSQSQDPFQGLVILKRKRLTIINKSGKNTIKEFQLLKFSTWIHIHRSNLLHCQNHSAIKSAFLAVFFVRLFWFTGREFHVNPPPT